MKKPVNMLFVLLLLLVSVNCSAEEIIHIATEEYPPHTSEILKYYGLDCHIVTEAFALEGIKVKYTFYPPKRALILAKHGKVDGVMPWTWRKERETDFYYPDPVLRKGIVYTFFHLKNLKFPWNPEKPDYSNLKEYTIGGNLGYDYGEAFQLAEKTGVITVERVAQQDQNFKKLLAGRVQLVIDDEAAGLYKLQSHFTPDQVSRVSYTQVNNLPGDCLHLLISKKSRKAAYFKDAFNKGLKRLRNSGEYDRFLAESKEGKYILQSRN